MPAAAVPYIAHDHSACIAEALDRAQTLCRDRGERLTTLRQKVLTLVLQSHRPLGAYDLLDGLNQEGRKAAPPTIYRTLEFLQQAGLVHRIASLNAFVACHHPGKPHSGCFLICQSCRNVLELESTQINDAVRSASADEGFSITDTTIEVAGLCPTCKKAGF
ncbi:Fur family transcriptional regulator [Hydrocarboniclastica marina]|uniref:Ferric uptake regulation protein n=1 Tax=Hydrocarboniclastica marina TaxID=2259620 RepID=A0A4P7XE74_9ALTE|nr:Fur family transcriptional regulator [Hydrocarboniclastica marina]MAL98804.1 Fur family transcriptional regulator [Alteromonadaceae bacterium]QCF24684.1 transcriptional repressor [Hydrocarboniclastica marina]